MIHYWSNAIPIRVKLSKKLSPPGQNGQGLYSFSLKEEKCTLHIRAFYKQLESHPRPQFHIHLFSRFDIPRSKYDPGPT